jgi:hypothetical protein
VFRAAVVDVFETQPNQEEDTEDTEQEDAGRPDPEIQRNRHAGQHGPADGVPQRVDVPLYELLVYRLVPRGDADSHHDAEDSEDLKEGFGDVVVGEPDEAPLEERPRREREDGDRGHAAEAAAESPSDEVRRNCDERPEHGRGDQNRHRDRLVAGRAEADDQRRRRDYLVEQRPELAVAGPVGEGRPRVKRHRRGPVLHDVLRRAIVIPGVVPAEEHLAVDDEVLPTPDAIPQHEPEQYQEDRNVVPALGPLQGGLEFGVVVKIAP